MGKLKITAQTNREKAKFPEKTDKGLYDREASLTGRRFVAEKY